MYKNIDKPEEWKLPNFYMGQKFEVIFFGTKLKW